MTFLNIILILAGIAIIAWQTPAVSALFHQLHSTKCTIQEKDKMEQELSDRIFIILLVALIAGIIIKAY